MVWSQPFLGQEVVVDKTEVTGQLQVQRIHVWRLEQERRCWFPLPCHSDNERCTGALGRKLTSCLLCFVFLFLFYTMSIWENHFVLETRAACVWKVPWYSHSGSLVWSVALLRSAGILQKWVAVGDGLVVQGAGLRRGLYLSVCLWLVAGNCYIKSKNYPPSPPPPCRDSPPCCNTDRESL